MDLFYTPIKLGRIAIGGPDRIDFLQRQTTNDMRALKPSAVLPNVLTSPTARILDFFYMVPDEEKEEIHLLSLSGKGSETAGYLQKRIFFMDKATVTDESGAVWNCALWGGEAARAAGLLDMEEIPAPGELADGTAGSTPVRLIHHPEGLGLGFLLEAPAGNSDDVEAFLQSAGVQQKPETELEAARIEAGFPGKPELSEEFTPFEAGLQTAVSSQKGCFTGQEVLARQVTFDKVTRGLAGLRLDSPAVSGSRAFFEGAPAGQVTSCAVSSRFGPIALAVLRKQYIEEGKRLAVRMDGSETEASVVVLPFA